jgi:4,4'-diaponeurosporenoate glycosyltransferase
MTLAAITLGLWFLGFLFFCRMPLCRNGPQVQDRPPLSVIVPARNEERNLATLLQSLEGQEPRPIEVIVVDDGSTDGTAALAAAAGALVVPSTPLPDGWRGKTWACQQGAQVSKGQVLLFVDADTLFEPGGLRRIRDAYGAGPGVLSLAPYHRVKRPYEELSAFFNLMMTAGTGAFTILGSRLQPAGLFGPFLMVDRNAYFEIGGHAAVKGRILENFYMATVFRKRHVPMHCCSGQGVFSMRMYPDGLRSLVEGWSKAFASGAAQTPRALLVMITAWIAGSILAPIEMLGGVCAQSLPAALLGLGLYGLFAFQIASMLRRIGSFRWCTSLLYPVPLLFYLIVFGRSSTLAALGKKVSWKGREIDGQPPRR